ncbi:MAG TPA: hypothetical protein ENN00_00320, partial [Bacillaceae bacterium]|nr:hypothetical protein [Bacillaceae bacterium]
MVEDFEGDEEAGGELFDFLHGLCEAADAFVQGFKFVYPRTALARRSVGLFGFRFFTPGSLLPSGTFGFVHGERPFLGERPFHLRT